MTTKTNTPKKDVKKAAPKKAAPVFEVKTLKTIKGYKVNSITQDGNFYVVTTNEATFKLPEAEYTSLLS